MSKSFDHIVTAVDKEGNTHQVTVYARPYSVTIARFARTSFKVRGIEIETIVSIERES